MRILTITDFHHPYIGGVEQHVRTLSNENVAICHSVSRLQQVRGHL